MDKYTVADSDTEILRKNKNKWYPNTHNINETQKHHRKQKKPDTKEYILYDSACMTF